MKVKEKAKAIAKHYDKYFTTIEYEYRGHKYDVTYPRGWQICCSPAWVQHQDEQRKIDKMIEAEKHQNEAKESIIDELDYIWNLMEW